MCWDVRGVGHCWVMENRRNERMGRTQALSTDHTHRPLGPAHNGDPTKTEKGGGGRGIWDMATMVAYSIRSTHMREKSKKELRFQAPWKLDDRKRGIHSQIRKNSKTQGWDAQAALDVVGAFTVSMA